MDRRCRKAISLARATLAVYKGFHAPLPFPDLRNGVPVFPRVHDRGLAHKTRSRYQVWQEGSHPQQLRGDDMLRQKLEYVHDNPVVRGYVDKAEDWRYSNARNDLGLPGLIDVITDWG